MTNVHHHLYLVLVKGGNKVLLSYHSYRDGSEEELIEVPDKSRSFWFLKGNFYIRGLLTERGYWVGYSLLQNLCGFILWSILPTKCHQLNVTVHLDRFVFCYLLQVRKGGLEAVLRVSDSNIFLLPILTRATSIWKQTEFSSTMIRRCYCDELLMSWMISVPVLSNILYIIINVLDLQNARYAFFFLCQSWNRTWLGLFSSIKFSKIFWSIMLFIKAQQSLTPSAVCTPLSVLPILLFLLFYLHPKH